MQHDLKPSFPDYRLSFALYTTSQSVPNGRELEVFLKYHAHQVYFFRNDKIIVLYKMYFFWTYFASYDDYLSANRDFQMDASRFVDFTYMTDLQTEQFFQTLQTKNFRPIKSV